MAEKILLSPVTRLSLTFDNEISLDNKGIFTLETYQEYISMMERIEVRRDLLIKNMLIIDAILYLLLNGQHWNLPYIDISVSDIPSVLIVVSILSSLQFFLVCLYQVNHDSYVAIVYQIGHRISRDQLIDPDFITASKLPFLFVPKIFREKMNLFGDDFYQSERPFVLFSKYINWLMWIVALIWPTAHMLVVGYSSFLIAQQEHAFLVTVFLIFAILVINVGALTMYIGAQLRVFSFAPMSSNQPLIDQTEEGRDTDNERPIE